MFMSPQFPNFIIRKCFDFENIFQGRFFLKRFAYGQSFLEHFKGEDSRVAKASLFYRCGD